jgi:Fe-S cluster assembly protein SufD
MSESTTPATTLILDPPTEGLMEGVTDALNADAVSAASEGAPQWLAARRAAAWSVYEQTPLPTTRLEEWRYTNLRRLLKLDRLGFTPASAVGAAEDPKRDHAFDTASAPARLRDAMAVDGPAAAHVIEIDGVVVHVDLDPALAAKGVVLTSLRHAVTAHPGVLETHLAQTALPAERGKFQALNAALWTDGVVLHVPRGVEFDLPVRVTRWVSEPGMAYFSRTLIVAEAQSRVSFVDEILSDDLPQQTLSSTAVEIVAKDGAQVQYVSLQRMGRGVFHLAQQRTVAGKDATLDTLNVTLGASVSRTDLNAQLLGSGSNSDMLGLYFAEEGQHFDHSTSQDHVAPHANSDLLYKGALDGDARTVFRGIIKVHPGAQQTDAYQTNRNLLLSRHARADSLPNLEIEADDVKCSHGASVGELDLEHLFYLMSRGIAREQAERLVVIGFLGEVLSRLPLAGVAEKVSRIIEERLGHG